VREIQQRFFRSVVIDAEDDAFDCLVLLNKARSRPSRFGGGAESAIVNCPVLFGLGQVEILLFADVIN
jgi:hypothetical protein